MSTIHRDPPKLTITNICLHFDILVNVTWCRSSTCFAYIIDIPLNVYALILRIAIVWSVVNTHWNYTACKIEYNVEHWFWTIQSDAFYFLLDMEETTSSFFDILCGYPDSFWAIYSVPWFFIVNSNHSPDPNEGSKSSIGCHSIRGMEMNFSSRVDRHQISQVQSFDSKVMRLVVVTGELVHIDQEWQSIRSNFGLNDKNRWKIGSSLFRIEWSYPREEPVPRDKTIVFCYCIIDVSVATVVITIY